MLFLQQILALFYAQAGASAVEVWGPIPAPMEKRAGVFRAHALLFCSDRKQLHQLINPWWPQIWQLPERRGIRCSLDIDPQELS